MNKEKVGSVTKEEKEEIKKLYERKLALMDILPSLNLTNEQKNEMYEKVVQDIGKTNLLFQSWWDEKGLKYNWKSAENGKWIIDFDTNDIFLLIN
jgi:CXXX repeat modification system protein